jgi:hypothetical protein
MAMTMATVMISAIKMLFLERLPSPDLLFRFWESLRLGSMFFLLAYDGFSHHITFFRR